MKEKVLPAADEIYRYLEFDEMKDFTLIMPDAAVRIRKEKRA